MVFQNYDLYPWLSTGANMVLTMKQSFRNKSKKELRSFIEENFEQVGLDKSVFDKYPNELSGGMRQRCALCRALALDSSIMLMDEPFGVLDAIAGNRLQRRLPGQLPWSWRADYIGYDSLHGQSIAQRFGQSAFYDIRLRIAVRALSEEQARLLIREMQCLYINGPAGASGINSIASNATGR